MPTITLLAKGLQNLNNYPYCNEDFTFYFSDERSFKMKINYAEFISPRVSWLRKSDSSNCSLYFEYHLNNLDEYFTDDIISMIQSLSSGHSTKINQLQGFKLLIISILLGNSELFQIISDTSEIQINDKNLDQYLHHLTQIYQFSHLGQYFNYNHIIDYIACHFFSIEKSKFLQLPKPILYSIISNCHLTIENEDSLFDFIKQIFSNKKQDDDEEFDINHFLEKVYFLRLSENKLKEAFNLNSMKLEEISG